MNLETNVPSYPTTPVFVISAGRAAEEFRCSFAQAPLFHQSSTRFETNLESFKTHCQTVTKQKADTQWAGSFPEYAALESWFAGILTSQTPFTMVSIEYDSIARMEQNSNFRDRVPCLIRWITTRFFPVIHIVDNNPLDCFVERILSETDGIQTNRPDDELAAYALEQISQMKFESSLFRQWLAGGRLLELSHPGLYNPVGSISRLVVRKLSHFLSVDADQLKTGRVCRRLDPGRHQAAGHVKRQLRPVLTRAGYEKLFDLPKAA